jgi:ankyrin repeat protein
MKELKGDTPILIASKRNKLQTVKFLIESNCDITATDSNDLNSLDNAIIFGLYDIAFEFIGKLPKKPVDEYLEIGNKLKSPYYNLPLLMDHLELKTEPSNVPSFTLSGKKAKGKHNLFRIEG